MLPLDKLQTIDAAMAQTLHDRLYYTVLCNLVPRKGHDNFLKDQQARDITAELVSKLDGLLIFKIPQAPGHSSTHYMTKRGEEDLEQRAAMAVSGRPHLLPVMNAKPNPQKDPADTGGSQGQVEAPQGEAAGRADGLPGV